MSKIEEVAQDDGMVWIEVRNNIAHNGLLYRRGIMKVSPEIAKILTGIQECNCPQTVGGVAGHDCTGPLLKHAVPYELIRPEPVQPIPTVDATTGASVDVTLHKLNVSDAIALIDRTEDGAKLKSLMDGEKKNPTFQGGRKKVLEAITDRLAMLAS